MLCDNYSTLYIKPQLEIEVLNSSFSEEEKDRQSNLPKKINIIDFFNRNKCKGITLHVKDLIFT